MDEKTKIIFEKTLEIQSIDLKLSQHVEMLHKKRLVFYQTTARLRKWIRTLSEKKKEMTEEREELLLNLK